LQYQRYSHSYNHTKTLTLDYIKRAKEIFSPKSLPDTDASYDVHNIDGSYRETVNVGSSYNSIYVKDVQLLAPSIEGMKTFLQSQVDSKIISQKDMDDRMNDYSSVKNSFLTSSS